MPIAHERQRFWVGLRNAFRIDDACAQPIGASQHRFIRPFYPHAPRHIAQAISIYLEFLQFFVVNLIDVSDEMRGDFVKRIISTARRIDFDAVKHEGIRLDASELIARNTRFNRNRRKSVGFGDGAQLFDEPRFFVVGQSQCAS